MANTRTVHFSDAAPTWQLAIAKVIKASAEEKGVKTKGADEWVRVITLASVDIDIDLDTRKFNVSPATKPVLEILVLEYLVVGVQEGGQANG